MFIENIVFGHSWDAVKHTQDNDFILFLNSPEKPYFFEPSTRLWFRSVFAMSVSGQIPFGVIRSVRVTGSTARVVATTGTVHSVEFSKIHVFDDQNLVCENEVVKENNKRSLVVDWVKTRHTGKYSKDSVYFEDNFVREVHFFKTNRVTGRPHNDLVAVSYLDEEELSQFEFSDTMARFKLEHVLKGVLMGAKNGLDKNGNIQYHKPKLEPYRRDVRSINLSTYRDSESIVFYKND